MKLYRLDIPSEAYIHFRAGAFVTIIADVLKPFGWHVLNTHEGGIIVRLERQPDRKYLVEPLHIDFSSFNCKRDELNLIGWVCEYFPTGSYENRVVFWTPELEERFNRSSPDVALIGRA